MSEEPKGSRSYSQVLQLNQELVVDLQSLIDDHEQKMQQLAALQADHEQARSEIGRLTDELRRAEGREDDLHTQLQQLESARVDQLSAVSAHLDALRSALDRYLHRDQHFEQKAS
jgi:predicted nuclease with TOPRIM domain